MPKRNDEMVWVHKDALEAARNDRGLTRSQLAERVGCSYSHYRNVEARQKRAKKALISRIAHVLHVSVDDLIDHSQVEAVA